MRPLADVRVLAIEQYGAGPWGTLQLADLGADVVKVEDPTTGGDVARYVPPFQQGEDSIFFEAFNRNKRSISLDLRHPRARGVFEDLVRECDAVFSNLRGHQAAKLRIRYGDLAHVNPRIVCCSLSGFGADGPRSNEGAYDATVQGLAGWQAITGAPGDPPTKSGLSLVDFCGGYVAAIGLLAGVWRARRDGLGADVDVSLFDTALAQLNYLGAWVASRGYEPQRHADSAHPSLVPFQNFRTADSWLVVACPKEDLWRRLCRVLERPDLLEDERYATFVGRDRERDELVTSLGEAFAARTTADWIGSLTEEGVPCAPINDVATALADPQAVARGAVVEIEHPTLGTVCEMATPLRIGGVDPPLCRAPFRGEHTSSLLRELCGYDNEQIEQLKTAGVLGDRAGEREVPS